MIYFLFLFVQAEEESNLLKWERRLKSVQNYVNAILKKFDNSVLFELVRKGKEAIIPKINAYLNNDRTAEWKAYNQYRTDTRTEWKEEFEGRKDSTQKRKSDQTEIPEEKDHVKGKKEYIPEATL